MNLLSDENGERFRRNIKEMEKRYEGACTPNMLADYCWTLLRDNPNESYKRKAKYLKTN